MPSELIFVLLPAACLLVAAVVSLVGVLRCRYGWQVWLLYVIERLHVGLVFRLRTNRRCPFPSEGPAIVIANHRSPVDPMLLWMNTHLTADSPGEKLRVINFLMAREYYEQAGVVGWISRSLLSIPVERDGRDMSAVRESIRRLRRGELVGIFPEGRLNRGEGLLPAIPGMALLALRAKVPVYPVFIHNAPQDGSSMVAPFMKRCRVRLTYGDPIDLSPWFGRRKDRTTLSEVSTAMMQELARLGGTTCAEPIDSDEPGGGRVRPINYRPQNIPQPAVEAPPAAESSNDAQAESPAISPVDSAGGAPDMTADEVLTGES